MRLFPYCNDGRRRRGEDDARHGCPWDAWRRGLQFASASPDVVVTRHRDVLAAAAQDDPTACCCSNKTTADEDAGSPGWDAQQNRVMHRECVNLACEGAVKECGC